MDNAVLENHKPEHVRNFNQHQVYYEPTYLRTSGIELLTSDGDSGNSELGSY